MHVTIEPLNQKVPISEGELLLTVINRQQLNVPFLCGGKGLCATCHVFVEQGMEALTNRSPQETTTLNAITGCTPASRLACQARIYRDGVVIRVPEGMYVGSIGELEALVGRRAGVSLLHPRTGEVLIEKGKLILRSTLNQLLEDQLSLNPLYEGNP